MNENPVFSIAGAMPGASEMPWKTAYPNPDAHLSVRPERVQGKRGPSFSMAGAMPGGSCVTHWATPFPTGESIYVDALRMAEARAALEAVAEATFEDNVVALPRGTARRRAAHTRRPKAA